MQQRVLRATACGVDIVEGNHGQRRDTCQNEDAKQEGKGGPVVEQGRRRENGDGGDPNGKGSGGER